MLMGYLLKKIQMAKSIISIMILVLVLICIRYKEEPVIIEPVKIDKPDIGKY